MTYSRNPTWKPGPAGATMITAAALENIELQLVASDLSSPAIVDAAMAGRDAAATSAYRLQHDARHLVPLSGAVFAVVKVGSTWPARPNALASHLVLWVGADPSPLVVTTGTAGMYASDVRIIA